MEVHPGRRCLIGHGFHFFGEEIQVKSRVATNGIGLQECFCQWMRKIKDCREWQVDGRFGWTADEWKMEDFLELSEEDCPEQRE